MSTIPIDPRLEEANPNSEGNPNGDNEPTTPPGTEQLQTPPPSGEQGKRQRKRKRRSTESKEQDERLAIVNTKSRWLLFFTHKAVDYEPILSSVYPSSENWTQDSKDVKEAKFQIQEQVKTWKSSARSKAILVVNAMMDQDDASQSLSKLRAVTDENQLRSIFQAKFSQQVFFDIFAHIAGYFTYETSSQFAKDFCQYVFSEFLMRTKKHLDFLADTAAKKYHDPVDNKDGWKGSFDKMTELPKFHGKINKGQFSLVQIVSNKKKSKKVREGVEYSAITESMPYTIAEPDPTREVVKGY